MAYRNLISRQDMYVHSASGELARIVDVLQTLSVSVKSIEDHGYLLDIGIPDASGFLAFKDHKSESPPKLRIGQLLDATISSISKNGRTYNVTVDPETFVTSTVGLLDCVHRQPN